MGFSNKKKLFLEIPNPSENILQSISLIKKGCKKLNIFTQLLELSQHLHIHFSKKFIVKPLPKRLSVKLRNTKVMRLDTKILGPHTHHLEMSWKHCTCSVRVRLSQDDPRTALLSFLVFNSLHHSWSWLYWKQDLVFS